MLHGTPEDSKVSGYSGTRRKLDVDDNEHAMYGISSQERRDNPCTVWIGTESINDSAKNTGEIENLCGGTPNSRAIKAEYRDTLEHGPRVFVTGIRVCTNKKGTRVKGFQLRGVQVYEEPDDNPPSPAPVVSILTAGRININTEARSKYVNDSTNPADFRNNCKEWHKWADCPYSGQVAIGLTAHFEAGKEPRSLTGVALQCRYISRSYVAKG